MAPGLREKTGKLIGSLSLLILVGAVAGPKVLDFFSKSSCRNIPGDESWPNQSDWDKLNRTVGGNLIANIPIGAVCHETFSGTRHVSLYDKERCDALRNVWHFPETHLNSPSSPMAYPFSNDSCNPFLDPETPCTIGYQAVYTINATSPSHFQEAIRFVKEHNIRLVIRNSGHDYLGKSTGAHSLAIWTHYIKSTELIKEYNSPEYVGPAIKLGAGVETGEAYAFAKSHGLVVVGGNCPSVGIAGGFIQGGGIGPFTSKYGLGADQVLEWEVVTGAGELVKATPSDNPDLFWALRGGGGGTYGVVASVTVKAFPDTAVSMAFLTVLNNGTNADALYSAIGTFIKTLPSIVDKGIYLSWLAAPFGFMLTPAIAPGFQVSDLDSALQPTIDELKRLGLGYLYSSATHPDWVTAHALYSQGANVSDFNLGGRLMPRSAVENNPDEVLSAVRYMTSQTVMSAVTFNAANGVSSPADVAANPYFRETLFSVVLGMPVDYANFTANAVAQDKVTYDLLPALEKITPDGGGYLNEADFQQPNFQYIFYRDHYEKLLQIKQKYDPDNIFYAKTAVGSESWKQDIDGRLCRA